MSHVNDTSALPRSGLLEPAHAADRFEAGFARLLGRSCATFGLMSCAVANALAQP
jgi:hypothetical protein